jgi:hypothetical protein
MELVLEDEEDVVPVYLEMFCHANPFPIGF